jgi:hypothetical protein
MTALVTFCGFPMSKLIAELIRLYLPDGGWLPEALARHLRGEAGLAIPLAAPDGRTRAMHLAFHKVPNGDEAEHWSRLCAVANALQGELDLPAPAVSISGGDAYGLWLSLAEPVPVAEAQEFLALLCAAYSPELKLAPDAASAPVALPPCLHQASGRWAAFIHPGMGAAFTEESGLEMMPPVAGQVAFLEGLKSIDAAQFQQALATLRQSHGAVPLAGAPAQPAPQRSSAPEGLLLKDATLEDIVRHLHSQNIEPTFRHIIPSR